MCSFTPRLAIMALVMRVKKRRFLDQYARDFQAAQAQDVLGEVVEDHLLRDGRDLVEPHLAPEPLDVELLGVAVAAMGLQRDVARLEPGLGAQQLEDCALGVVATVVSVPERGRVVMPGVTKDSLTTMPDYHYANRG